MQNGAVKFPKESKSTHTHIINVVLTTMYNSLLNGYERFV